MFTDRLKAYLEAKPKVLSVWVNKEGVYHVTKPTKEGYTEYQRADVLKPKKTKEENNA
jgi:hypothetical protein